MVYCRSRGGGGDWPSEGSEGGHCLTWVTSAGARSQMSREQKPPENTARLSWLCLARVPRGSASPARSLRCGSRPTQRRHAVALFGSVFIYSQVHRMWSFLQLRTIKAGRQKGRGGASIRKGKRPKSVRSCPPAPEAGRLCFHARPLPSGTEAQRQGDRRCRAPDTAPQPARPRLAGLTARATLPLHPEDWGAGGSGRAQSVSPGPVPAWAPALLPTSSDARTSPRPDLAT